MTQALTIIDQQRRVAAAVAALAPNTRKAYGSAWSGQFPCLPPHQ